MSFLRWDEEYGLLVDEMGLPVPINELLAIHEQIEIHSRLSDDEIKAVALSLTKLYYPSMVPQIDFDVFTRTGGNYE